MNSQKYDYIILGAGIYGLFAARHLALKEYTIALIDFDSRPLQRASYVNQARVHNGYHYPRSVSTAIKSSKYYHRFNEEFSFAINDKFKKIYAISKNDSLTNAEQFSKFCEYVDIPAVEIGSKTYFNEGTVEATFETVEYSYDAQKIRLWYEEQFKLLKNIHQFYGKNLLEVSKNEGEFFLNFEDGTIFQTSNVLNATYASTNQLLHKFNYELFKTKYEICEVILTEVSDKIKNVGITVMDGPFFSVMPFGLSPYHSLTSVGHTPHETSHDSFPTFTCQKDNENCNPMTALQNCNTCTCRPSSAWIRMHQLSQKYLIPDIQLKYRSSLFAVKALISSSELDDSRPTIVKKFSEEPSFISVFSGKFNTIYDLEEVL